MKIWLLLICIPCHVLAVPTCAIWEYFDGALCVTCPIGKVASSTGLACEDCPIGFVRGNRNGNRLSGCVPADDICYDTQRAEFGRCVLCQDGFVANSLFTDCEPCPNGKVRGNSEGTAATVGCIAATDEFCAPFEIAEGGKCVKCQDGWVGTAAYSVCSPCDDGFVRGSADGSADNECVPGAGKCTPSQRATGGKCVECDAGKEANSIYSSCVVCTDGLVRGNAGGTMTGVGCADATGICLPSQKATGGKCVTCDDGLVGETSNYASCAACPAGQVRDNRDGTGSGGCAQANGICLKGEIGTGGKCAACPANQVANDDYTACTFCADGTVYSSPSAGCVDASGVCSVAEKATGGSCVACPNGAVANPSGYTACEACPDGQVRGNSLGDADSGCVQALGICLKGQKATGGKCEFCPAPQVGHPGYTACAVCADGSLYFGSNAGCGSAAGTCLASQKATGGFCAACPDGSVANAAYTACEPCPDGQVRGNAAGNLYGASCRSASGICAKSQIATGGRCVACLPNQVANDAFTACALCADGTLYSTTPSTDCVPAAGTCSASQKATGGFCVGCPIGAVANAAYTACEVCPNGQVRGNDAGDLAGGSCVGASGICAESQKAIGGKCVTCDDGYEANIDYTACVICVDGKVRGNAAGNAATECKPASGICFESEKAIGGKCVTCDDGFEANSDFTDCVVCADGKVRGNRAGNANTECQAALGICFKSQKAIGGKCVTCNDGYEANSDYTDCVICVDGKVRGNAAGSAATECQLASGICAKSQKAIGGKCVTCQDGYEANIDYTDCVVCADGKVRGNRAGNAATECQLASGICFKSQKAIGGKCVTCPNGYEANSDYTDCVICVDGKVRGSPDGSAATECQLASGICARSQKAIGGQCVTCDDGYEANVDFTGCVVCADGKVRGNRDGNAATECKAASGICFESQKATGGKCVTCDDGYEANDDFTDCVVCVDGKVRGNSQGSAATECKDASPFCNKSQKATGGKCVSCPDGFEAKGDFTGCVVCPDGKVRGNPEGSAPTECKAAAAYCNVIQKATGGKCVTCPDGFEATSDFTDCIVCPDGHVRGNKVGNAVSACVPAKGICALSEKAVGGKCVSCPIGFVSISDYTDCAVCDPGRVRGNAEGTALTSCVSASGRCTLNQKATGGKCVTCPNGFEATSDFTECVVCADGKVRGKDGSAVTACQAASGICDESQKATGGKCVTCPDGFEANSDFTDCVVCADGKVRGNPDGTAATECQAASGICFESEKATGGKCVTCPNGFEATSDFTDCIVCADGKVRGNPNGSANTECQAASGICLESQRATGGKCVTCANGSAANSDYTGCTVCPVGTVRGNPAGSASTGCRAASGICFLSQKGSGGKCVTCQDGFVANSAYTDCVVCAPGSVRGNAAGKASTGCVAASGICSSNQKAVGGKCVSCPSGMIATPDFTDCCRRKKVKGKYVCYCGKYQKLVNGKCVPKGRLLRDN